MFKLCTVFLIFALLIITGHVQQVAACQQAGQTCDAEGVSCCDGVCVGSPVGVCVD